MRYAYFALGAVFLLSMSSLAYAAESTTSVSINNTVDSSSNVTTSSESHVRIEVNGEVKEFNTSGNQKVDWESEDGKSSVKIDNTGTSVKTNSDPTPSQAGASGTVTPSPTHEPTPTSLEHESSEHKANFAIPLTPLSMVVSLVESIFKLF